MLYNVKRSTILGLEAAIFTGTETECYEWIAAQTLAGGGSDYVVRPTTILEPGVMRSSLIVARWISHDNCRAWELTAGGQLREATRRTASDVWGPSSYVGKMTAGLNGTMLGDMLADRMRRDAAEATELDRAEARAGTQ